MGSWLKKIRDELSIRFSRSRGSRSGMGPPKGLFVIGSGIGGMASGALFSKIVSPVYCPEEMNKELIGGHGRC
jgi:hypothetical protein